MARISATCSSTMFAERQLTLCSTFDTATVSFGYTAFRSRRSVTPHCKPRPVNSINRAKIFPFRNSSKTLLLRCWLSAKVDRFLTVLPFRLGDPCLWLCFTRIRNRCAI